MTLLSYSVNCVDSITLVPIKILHFCKVV